MIVVRRAYLKPLLSALILLTVLSIVVPVDRLGWGGFVLLGILFGVLYLLGLCLVRFFDGFDLAIARKFLPILGAA